MRRFFPEELLVFNMQILHSFFLLADKVIKSKFARGVFKQAAVWHRFSGNPRATSREHCVPATSVQKFEHASLAGGGFDCAALCNRVIRRAESGAKGKTTV